MRSLMSGALAVGLLIGSASLAADRPTTKPAPKLSELSGRFVGFKLVGKRLEGTKLIVTVAEGNKSSKVVTGFKGTLYLCTVMDGRQGRISLISDEESRKALKVGEVFVFELGYDLPNDDEQDRKIAKIVFAAAQSVEGDLSEVYFDDGTVRKLKD